MLRMYHSLPLQSYVVVNGDESIVIDYSLMGRNKLVREYIKVLMANSHHIIIPIDDHFSNGRVERDLDELQHPWELVGMMPPNEQTRQFLSQHPFFCLSWRECDDVVCQQAYQGLKDRVNYLNDRLPIRCEGGPLDGDVCMVNRNELRPTFDLDDEKFAVYRRWYPGDTLQYVETCHI